VDQITLFKRNIDDITADSRSDIYEIDRCGSSREFGPIFDQFLFRLADCHGRWW